MNATPPPLRLRPSSSLSHLSFSFSPLPPPLPSFPSLSSSPLFPSFFPSLPNGLLPTSSPSLSSVSTTEALVTPSAPPLSQIASSSAPSSSSSSSSSSSTSSNAERAVKEKRPRKKACHGCHQAKTTCTGGFPCSRCTRLQKTDSCFERMAAKRESKKARTERLAAEALRRDQLWLRTEEARRANENVMQQPFVTNIPMSMPMMPLHVNMMMMQHSEHNFNPPERAKIEEVLKGKGNVKENENGKGNGNENSHFQASSLLPLSSLPIPSEEELYASFPSALIHSSFFQALSSPQRVFPQLCLEETVSTVLYVLAYLQDSLPEMLFCKLLKEMEYVEENETSGEQKEWITSEGASDGEKRIIWKSAHPHFPIITIPAAWSFNWNASPISALSEKTVATVFATLIISRGTPTLVPEVLARASMALNNGQRDYSNLKAEQSSHTSHPPPFSLSDVDLPLNVQVNDKFERMFCLTQAEVKLLFNRHGRHAIQKFSGNASFSNNILFLLEGRAEMAHQVTIRNKYGTDIPAIEHRRFVIDATGWFSQIVFTWVPNSV